MAVLSTYRLSLRGDGLTFADAEALLDYLDDLGVSHLHLSPTPTATPGSTRGYDMTDPTTMFADLGGAEGFYRLTWAARARGMGLVVDIAPNHVGVESPDQNRWRWDVLARGLGSAVADHFDIDRSADPDGRIILPVLGSADDLDPVVVGTTGYDGRREIGGLFVDPAGEAALTELAGSAPVLVALNETGSAPSRFTMSVDEFHAHAGRRAQQWPTATITLSSHDTGHSEDVRARISVLSQLADEWPDRVARWNYICSPPDAATGLFLWQTMFGVWPVSGEVDDQLRSRLQDYARKAIREAGVHTGWMAPDAEFEREVQDWIDAVLEGPVTAEITALVSRAATAAQSDALAQKLLSLTVPGVPDIYHGTEIFDVSLVDPDDRRPVDFSRLRTELAEGNHPKMRVVAAALHSRRERPATYLSGGYAALSAAGVAPERVIAFTRGDDVLVAVPRWTLRETGWDQTYLTLPEGIWTDRLTGRVLRGTVSAAELFTDLPGVLLER